MTLEEDPNVMRPAFLGRPDVDWRGFSAQEIADLRALRELHRPWSSQDRDWAGVPLHAGNGVMEIVPFSIDLVEPHCKRYWRHEASESFVLTNEAVQP